MYDILDEEARKYAGMSPSEGFKQFLRTTLYNERTSMESGALPRADGEPVKSPPPAPKDRKLTQYVVFIWRDGCLRPLLAPDGEPAKWGAGNAPAAISKALGQEGPTITEQYGPKGTAIAVPASNLHSQPYELAPPAGWEVRLG